MASRGIREMIAQMIMVGFKEEEVGHDTPVVRAVRRSSLGGVVLYFFIERSDFRRAREGTAENFFGFGQFTGKRILFESGKPATQDQPPAKPRYLVIPDSVPFFPSLFEVGEIKEKERKPEEM